MRKACLPRKKTCSFYAKDRRTIEPTYNPPRRTEESPPPKDRRRIIERLWCFGSGKYMVVTLRIGDFSRKI